MKKIRNILLILINIIPLFSDSQNWVQIGNGAIGYSVKDMYVDTTYNSFYIGSDFLSSTNDTVKGIAKWNGSSWDSVGSGLGKNATIYSMIKYNNELYVGGVFTLNHGAPADCIAKWNDTVWQSAGGDPSSVVFDFTKYNNELYGVGHLGGSYCITKWNGTSWNNVGSFPCGLVWLRSIAVYKGELYVAGLYNNDSCRTCIERWNGSAWNCVGNGIICGLGCNMDGGVFDMIVYNDELYVAGGFGKSDGNPDNCIARWDGNNWHSVGGGLNIFVYKLVVFNNELYACGEFTTAGGIPANKIAKWNGTKWCSLGSTINNVIYSACVYNNEIYIGGTFSIIDGNTVNHIAKWVGGNYIDTCGNADGISESSIIENEIYLYPNPSEDYITIENTALSNDALISIYNIEGELLLCHPMKQASIKLDVSALQSGVYIAEVITEKGVARKKFIKE